MKMNVGEYAFLAGVAIAILAGLATFTGGWVAVVLALLGLIVGLLNISAKETIPFLLASVALLLVGSAGLENLPLVGGIIKAIMANIVAFVAPAAVVIALKTVFDLARKK